MPASVRPPWRARCLALLPRVPFRRRERRLLEAILAASDAAGRCWHGNARLAAAARLGPTGLCRSVRYLEWLGILGRWWVASHGTYHRVLHVREAALVIYAQEEAEAEACHYWKRRGVPGVARAIPEKWRAVAPATRRMFRRRDPDQERMKWRSRVRPRPRRTLIGEILYARALEGE